MAAVYLTQSALAARYPEIADTIARRPDYVQTWLDTAAQRTPLDPWGVFADEAHGALAMHLMAITPFGQQAGLTSKAGTSTYGEHRKRLESEMGPAGFVRLAGGGPPFFPGSIP